jgi:hypothetical protein
MEKPNPIQESSHTPKDNLGTSMQGIVFRDCHVSPRQGGKKVSSVVGSKDQVGSPKILVLEDVQSLESLQQLTVTWDVIRTKMMGTSSSPEIIPQSYNLNNNSSLGKSNYEASNPSIKNLSGILVGVRMEHTSLSMNKDI